MHVSKCLTEILPTHLLPVSSEQQGSFAGQEGGEGEQRTLLLRTVEGNRQIRFAGSFQTWIARQQIKCWPWEVQPSFGPSRAARRWVQAVGSFSPDYTSGVMMA